MKKALSSLTLLFGLAILLGEAQALVAQPEPRSMPLPASGPVEFSCTPEGFTLAKTESGYSLSGTLETPTPGYGYSFGVPEEVRDGHVRVKMTLRGPEGAVIQVISALGIVWEFQRAADLARLTVEVGKPFTWGPGEISCAPAPLRPCALKPRRRPEISR